jgi:phage anti-repressor protein
LGFTRRDNAIRRIKSELTENEDYNITLLQTEERSGHNKETIYLTIDGFKDLCLVSKTKKAKEIRKILYNLF